MVNISITMKSPSLSNLPHYLISLTIVRYIKSPWLSISLTVNLPDYQISLTIVRYLKSPWLSISLTFKSPSLSNLPDCIISLTVKSPALSNLHHCQISFTVPLPHFPTLWQPSVKVKLQSLKQNLFLVNGNEIFIIQSELSINTTHCYSVYVYIRIHCISVYAYVCM